MDTLKICLFLWLSMALIKWIIMFATTVNTIFKYDESKPPVSSLMLNSIIGALMSVAMIVVMWPVALYNEKLAYFSFPDKGMERLFIQFIQKYDD